MTHTAPATIDELTASRFDDQHEQFNFRADGREVYIARDEIARNRHVYVVGVAGDPHSSVTETTLAAAKATASALLAA